MSSGGRGVKTRKGDGVDDDVVRELWLTLSGGLGIWRYGSLDGRGEEAGSYGYHDF